MLGGTLHALRSAMNKRRRYKAKARRARQSHAHFLKLQRMVQMSGRMYRDRVLWVPTQRVEIE